MLRQEAAQKQEKSSAKSVGLISDTHVPVRAREVPKKVFEVFEKVDYIIHAGDLVDLSVIDALGANCTCPSRLRKHGWT
jgi:predicted phosphodiesterase